MMRRLSGFIVVMVLLAACSGQESRERIPADAPGYVDGKPVHPTIKIGKPYRVNGEEYEPRYDPQYDETGLASWYGPGFHGKSTANGERYNQWAMTAAHKTLPMPSIVKVTHLKTGKEIRVRVNDRGPFSDGRIIDLSRGAAEELGMIGEGLAPVRVQYLKPDTEDYIAKLQLDKPDEWTETDVMIAQMEDRAVAITESAPLDAVSMSELEPAAHPPVAPATAVPDRFAYNAPVPQETTVAARGVEMVEIGYDVDAFSVLGDEEAEVATFGEAPAPALEPALSQSGYFVQAGSFGVRENAYRLKDKIGSLATVEIRQINGLHRVRLGPVADDAAARALAAQLEHYGIRDATIMKE